MTVSRARVGSGAAKLSSGQSWAMAVKGALGGPDLCCGSMGVPWGVGGWLGASPTMFSWPGVCLMSDVNSAMNDNCSCWWTDHVGVVWKRDVTRGLWSVSGQKRCPSRRNRKWRTRQKAASSRCRSLEYRVSAPYSFLEKKASGCQLPPASCCRTPPTWV
jgi:hypothetical protein